MKPLILLLLIFLAVTGFVLAPLLNNTDWPEYNGNGDRSHYSVLSQIRKDNVAQLKVAWTYASGGADTARNRSQMQCNPIIINGILYGVSASIQAFAVDAASGKEIWKSNLPDVAGTLSRGVTYWSDNQNKRIFFGAANWLYALDAINGKLVDSFGINGKINLKTGIERPGSDDFISSNTPNTIYNNLIIVGGRVAENETALLGDVRAYDTVTGKLVWTFHTIPDKGEFGYNTWLTQPARQKFGGANAWAGMAIDRKRGIIYIPTGSAAFDFWGGNRPGDNLFANCLIALDAATGKRLWHYQLVHHDIWDRDPPCPPNLVTLNIGGKQLDAVVQITKQGHIFVFDRVTGKPLFPIKETAFRMDAMQGEKPSKTQPIPTLPLPFTRQTFGAKDFNTFVADRDSLEGLLKKARFGTAYIPITGDMTIFYPGTDGGAQWGGAATDPNGVMYIPAKEIPVYTTLKKKEVLSDQAVNGSKLYQLNCSACHGTDKTGNHDGSYPSLVNVEKRLTKEQITGILQKGKGMMPSFSHITDAEKNLIIDFLLNKNTDQKIVSTNNGQVPYHNTGYNRWYDKNGYPVSQPPWGTLTAVDLSTGQRRWQVPLGEYKALTDKGIPPTGTDNYGGPLVTSSGLIFIAASRDEKIRAFDKDTGKILWTATLPAAGYASASTYSVNGKQFIVIACGGGKLNTKSGDKYVAFALP
ncbi:pyrroloquinoline quinone-dependent dehydrogenase [Dyadobacter sp. LJ53]|uniref:pyrroloquinoline quinone-dependent dehydrogenase n=1 Tax=Dyadobacter chenwenxiniae TaxID=2906456 RepID=UPI001F201E4F|nr:pyrroloquinoline quinone-dependent dehydrogenase [Dyadobacter chenwenxiniae]MCF0053339.1 pyrroloquinoline quinone-dependent dehydrogenase [Dyadobacter chenwenxiniae]